MDQQPHVGPNVFVVLPAAIAAPERLAEMVLDLMGKGYICAAAVTSAEACSPALEMVATGAAPPTTAPAWIFTTHEIAQDDDILAARHADVLVKFARILRRHGVRARILGAQAYSDLVGWRIGDYFRAEPDRDLTLAPGERFVADFTSNAVRSTIWLIERDGDLVIRKAFSRHYPGFLDNEMAARATFGDPRIVEIRERRGDVLYMPFIRGSKAWDGRLFSFCRRDRARAVRDFLAHINRAGYSMVDVNPSAFLFDQRDGLKVVDFEFFLATRPAEDFTTSCDHTGDFDKPGLPKKNGWVRYWYDAVGGSWERIERMSDLGYRAHLLLHLVAYRLPVRAGRALEQGGKIALNRVRRMIGLKRTGQDAGQFRA